MRMATETITVINRLTDASTGYDVYQNTVISGASWYCEIQSTVDQGLKAADKFTVRIPTDADFGGKSYTPPQDFDEMDVATGVFTLRNGDYILHGTAPSGMTPAELQKMYPEMFTILGITDNRRGRTPHWKVVGS